MTNKTEDKTEIVCACGDALIPGSLATEAFIASWRAEHQGHTAPVKAKSSEEEDAYEEDVEEEYSEEDLEQDLAEVLEEGFEKEPGGLTSAPDPELAAETAGDDASRLDVVELCRAEGFVSSPYADGAVILADQVDALVCARALRKKGLKAIVSGLILQVEVV